MSWKRGLPFLLLAVMLVGIPAGLMVAQLATGSPIGSAQIWGGPTVNGGVNNGMLLLLLLGGTVLVLLLFPIRRLRRRG